MQITLLINLIRVSALLAVFSSVVTAAETILIPTQSSWRYFDKGDDLGTEWLKLDYAPAKKWETGPAPLGYGDKGLGTSLSFGKDKNDKHLTTYFLREFEVSDPKSLTYLKIELLRDDGAVVHINGREVLRENMPAGVVRFHTSASGKVGGSEENEFHLHELFDVPLRTGRNLIAVEIHQENPRSSDIRFDLKLTGSDQKLSQVGLVRGPYLQVGTSSSMILRWRTRRPSSSVVRYGAAPDQLKDKVEIKEKSIEHEVLIKGLKSRTQYFYSIGDGEEVLAGGDADHFFFTSPQSGSNGPVHAWIIGDSGTANANAKAVYNAYMKAKGDRYTDLWLMLGDNAYNSGTDKEYQRAVFDLYDNLLPQTPLWSTRGNHERSAEVYYGIFNMPSDAQAGGVKSGTEAYYSFDYGNIHFICLDSYDTDRSASGDMFKWLKADLEATAQTFIVAYWHHPPYTKGSHDSDRDNDSGGRMRDMRETFLPLLEKGGVDLLFAGHSHCYERSYLINGHYGKSDTFNNSMVVNKGDGKPRGDGPYEKPSPEKSANKGAVYIVAGNGGKISGGKLNHPAMYLSLNELGSVILEAEGNRMDVRLIDYRGQVRDNFRITKGD